MDKIIESLKGHVRVNESNSTVEIYNEYGTKMRIAVDAETLAEYKKNYPSY